ncbi:hypothetical protein [Gymnodinialimonas hymeniacidonis]|uniref:hypothetical protein n=1 Tax=Gymnodinialimonas hymeniacidonis TaxID=3126508 RepID=UPI0034C676D3
MKYRPGMLVPKGFNSIADLFQARPKEFTSYVLANKGEKSGSKDIIVSNNLEGLLEAAMGGESYGSTLVVKSVGGYSDVVITRERDEAPPLVAFNLLKGNSGASSAHAIGIRAGESSTQYKNTLYENCEIGRLYLQNDTVDSLAINGGVIGVLDLTSLEKSSQLEIELRDCQILQVRVDRSLALRSLVVDRVSLSTSTEKLGERLSQQEFRAPVPQLDRASFGYLGEWARKTGSSEIAHLARGHELAIEQSTTRGLYGLWLRLWGLTSDHGLSPGKPLAWLLGLFLLNTLMICLSGSELGLSNDQLAGWRTNLNDGSHADSLERAIVSSFEGLTSPLGVVSGRRLVIPSNNFAAGFQVFYGFSALGLISLSVFSVRRRFKV